MKKTASHRQGSRKKRVRSLAQILKTLPRIPSAQSRRLNSLLNRAQFQKLPKDEDRELRALIELVDHMTYLRVANAAFWYWHETLTLASPQTKKRRLASLKKI